MRQTRIIKDWPFFHVAEPFVEVACRELRTEEDFLKAAVWTTVAAGLSMLGVIHAYELTATGVQNKFGFAAAPEFALMYGVSAGFLVLLHLVNRGR